MSALRLLADDLTGALDSAAPFAAASGPVTVRWFADEENGLGPVCIGNAGGWVVSTGSRDLPEAEASARIRALAPALAVGRPAFKKIDSLLRGNTVAEIISAHQAGGFRRTIVTPAFPGQGRLVRRGRLIMRARDGTEMEIADLRAMLAAAGADAAITVHDAETDADLAALAAAEAGSPGRLLWAGASGLARALCGPAGALALPVRAPLLLVTGSRHAVTRAFLDRLAASGQPAMLRDPGVGEAGAVGREAAVLLARRRSAVIDAAPPRPDSAAAARMAACLAPLAAAPAPGLLLVLGGDTLVRLLAQLRCTVLRILGEVAPGLPLSVVEDGPWAGVRLVSRSGAFEDGGLIARAIAEAVERE